MIFAINHWVLESFVMWHFRTRANSYSPLAYHAHPETNDEGSGLECDWISLDCEFGCENPVVGSSYLWCKGCKGREVRTLLARRGADKQRPQMSVAPTISKTCIWSW